MASIFVDTPAKLIDFLDNLPDCKGQPPSLYIDLEGNDLSRHGTLSIITILVPPQNTSYLIDITTLGQEAFTTKSKDGLSFKTILESGEVIKVFFDVRNDSDALFNLHSIHLHGIEDLQLCELAARPASNRRVVNGLAKCMERDLYIPFSEKETWQNVKTQGRKLFSPELGGSYAVFDQRPMAQAMREYCVQDVVYMPKLRERYLGKLCDAWYVKILEEGEARVSLSHSLGYNGKGRHMALGPVGWQMWEPALGEMGKRTMFVATPVKETPVSSTTTTNATATASSITTTDPASASSSEQSRKPTTLAEALELANEHAKTNEDDTQSHNSDDNDDDDVVYNERYMPSYSYPSSPSEDSVRDLTACDNECGYCGRCLY